MMRTRPLHRRAVLRAAGVTIGLPLLELMLEDKQARAAAPPKRFFVSFAGESTGWGRSLVDPKVEGPGYDLTAASKPLGDHNGIKDAITVVTGLRIPWRVNGVVPPAGREIEFHDAALGVQMSGLRQTVQGSPVPRGITCDQLMVPILSGNARFKSLQYRIQATGYRGSAPEDLGTLSWSPDNTGRLRPLRPTASPKVAFDSLFSGLTADPRGADAAELERRRRLAERDASVLDLVLRRSERLQARLGQPDRMRLERHFDEIRDIERRLRMVPPAAATPNNQCARLPDPGPDGAADVQNRGGGTIGWSNETLRGKLLCDLIHVAFACDLTRVATLVMTYCSSFLNAQAFAGVNLDVHSLSHGNSMNTGEKEQSAAIAWHWNHFAYLCAKLRDTPEGNGTLLDNTVLVHLSEGGSGFDPAGNGNNASHSTEKMVVLVGGRAGGLKPGRHIRGAQAHPCSVVLSAMNAAGFTGSALGEVTQDFPALFG